MTQDAPRRSKAPSRLAPHWETIQKLRKDDYSLSQIVDYLAQAGVEITIAGLQQYIKRQTARDAQPVYGNFKDLRTRLGMTQTEVADFLATETKRSCPLRTVQAWEAPPSVGSARNAADWALKILSEEASKRGC